MPLAPVMFGTGLTGTGSHQYCLFIDGLDVIRQPGTAGTVFGTDIDSVRVRDTRGQTPVMEFTIDDPSKVMALRSGANVYFCDHRGGRSPGGAWKTGDIFRGILISANKKLMGAVAVQWECVALGLDCLLDREVLTEGILDATKLFTVSSAIQVVAGTLDGRLSAVVFDNRNQSTAASGTLIQNGIPFGVSIAMAGKTARQVLGELADAATFPGGVYVGNSENLVDVDVQGRIRWLYDKPNPSLLLSPIAEGTAATTPAPSNIRSETDQRGMVNAVYVRGVDAASSGWFTDSASIDAYGRFEAYIEVPWVVSADMVQYAGNAFLSQHRPIQRIHFTLADAHDSFFPIPADELRGWNTGRTAVLNSGSGLWTNGQFTLHEIAWSFQGGGTVLKLALGFAGASSRGSSVLAQQSSFASEQTRSAARLTGGLGEVAVRVKAGTPTDADFDIARDGFVVVDTSGQLIWVRSLGVWMSTPISFNARVTKAVASANLILSTTVTDIASATITATALADEVWLVIGVFDMNCQVAGTNVGVGRCYFDGGDVGAIATNNGSAVNRGTHTQVWNIAATAGEHTVKLRGDKTVADGTHVILANQTSLTLIRLPA